MNSSIHTILRDQRNLFQQLHARPANRLQVSLGISLILHCFYFIVQLVNSCVRTSAQFSNLKKKIKEKKILFNFHILFQLSRLVVTMRIEVQKN